MKTKEQIKQGCGEVFEPKYLGFSCGDINPLKSELLLCPTCQAVLEHTEDFEKMIDEIKKEYDEGLVNTLLDVVKNRITYGEKEK